MNYLFKYITDKEIWQLQESIPVILSNGENITINAGMLTDGRSTPKVLYGFLPSFNKYILAYLIHDWLYINDYKWSEGTRKAQKFADDEMLYWELKLGMGKFEAYLCYYAVRIFGRRVFVR